MAHRTSSFNRLKAECRRLVSAAVQGHYVVTSRGVSFTPQFPFGAGRAYRVVFNPTKMPRPREAAAVTATVGLPAIATAPTPDAPWKAGEHHLVALSFLEDPQGNQINRPFEEAVDAPRPERAPDAFRISFTTQPSR